MAEELTKRQRYWLEHIRRASKSGKTLKAYAKSRRLSVGMLYNVKSELTRAGILPGPESPTTAPAFVPVRIEPTPPPRSVIRLTHPSGWLLECEGWPEPAWLEALVRGTSGDASA